MQLNEIYIETYGCTANQNSSEIMKGLIKQSGLNITENINLANLIIINSCIVKEPTQEKIRRRIQDLLDKNKSIILTGCIARLNSNSFKEQLGRNIFLLDSSQIKHIPDLIKDISDNTYSLKKYLEIRNEVKLNLPKMPKNKIIGITQISEGCLGNCSYCIVKLAKGKLFSYPMENILSSIESDIKAGCKEIWITSQDNASYGNEQGKYLLPELLKKILEIPGKFKIRIGMMNPNNVLKILPELIEVYKNPKMFKFLHIPIQSGSDKILKDMNRKYLLKDILKIINEFKKQIPEITIATDIILSYPTESEEDFKKTISLIRQIKPEILNRSNFCSRQGTQAEKLPFLSPDIINKRAKEIMNLHLEICNNLQKNYLNKEIKVLIDSRGWEGTWLGRTENYKLAIVHTQKNVLGKTLNVKVDKIHPHYLICSERI